MQVFLVQHGEAKPETEDPSRPLTEAGQENVTQVARHAARLGLPVAGIRHSGKLRARQTAEILAEHLAPAQGSHEMTGLAPGDDPAAAQAEVQDAREPLMLVGHLPHLARLTSALLVGDPNREIVRFRNGAIVCLLRGDRAWVVQWILTPELILA